MTSASAPPAVDRHNTEIQENRRHWERKPALRAAYRRFHEQIAALLAPGVAGHTVELGSGIGNIKDVIPDCIRTDLFPNPWLDQVENAYALTFADASVANLILFDVLHHLRYPGTAFAEFRRVLRPGGRVILFEPCISALGRIVYGLLHHEPVALRDAIAWEAPAGWSPAQVDYYAAQGNAYRIFVRGQHAEALRAWRRIACRCQAALVYIATGGYSKPQLVPNALMPIVRGCERLGDWLPALCATRLLVALEKPDLTA